MSEQAGVGSDKLVELIREQHGSPALIRYADRIAGNKFNAEGGFNLAGGITDARYVSTSRYYCARKHGRSLIDVPNKGVVISRA